MDTVRERKEATGLRERVTCTEIPARAQLALHRAWKLDSPFKAGVRGLGLIPQWPPVIDWVSGTRKKQPWACGSVHVRPFQERQ